MVLRMQGLVCNENADSNDFLSQCQSTDVWSENQKKLNAVPYGELPRASNHLHIENY